MKIVFMLKKLLSNKILLRMKMKNMPTFIQLAKRIKPNLRLNANAMMISKSSKDLLGWLSERIVNRVIFLRLQKVSQDSLEEL